MQTFNIIWSGQGGELDRATVTGDESGGDITKALIEMVRGQIVSAGDSFTIEEVDQ